MTSEEKVKRVYPRAELWGYKGMWHVFDRPTTKRGAMHLARGLARKSWAWATAWRNIELAQREKEKEQ
jgi:hypothetical protein